MMEKLLLLLAAGLSGYAFWRGFGPVLRIIRTSRKDADFQLAPVGRRVREFLWEVVCQAKVIRERPLPGLAHALVFWGFCAFAVVTLNHLAIGFGGRLLSRGSIYFAVAAAFAVMVAVSIAGLFVRRFLIRPKWLGQLSMESGAIALLIFILMTTYLASLATDTKLLWWAHTAALLVFLPLVPHTKHLHLVLSPF